MIESIKNIWILLVLWKMLPIDMLIKKGMKIQILQCAIALR